MTDRVEELFFFVEGTPAPQGSMRHVGGGRLVASSKKLRPWRAAVVKAATDALAGRDGIAKHEPVSVTVEFYMPRGKTVTRRHPTVFPDVDKLLRAVFDALTTAGVYADDAQVVSALPIKHYALEGHPPGAHISVRRTT